MYLGQRYNKMRKEESESAKKITFALVFLMVSGRSDASRPSALDPMPHVVFVADSRGNDEKNMGFLAAFPVIAGIFASRSASQ